MSNLSVAVVKSDFHDQHSASWGCEWLAVCREESVRHELINWRVLGAFESLLSHDVVLWHFSHYSAEEMKFARSMLSALKAHGCEVFPGNADSSHFDDKVAQAYLMRSLDIPTPQNYVLHCTEAVEAWIGSVGQFPVVAKLRGGSGSSNVKLIYTVEQLRNYSVAMFGDGQDSRPSILYKVRSNLVSASSLGEAFRRLKRAPEFLFSWRNASKLDRERGYVYLQEFVPDLGYDLKVVVVGDQLSYICRAVRAGDFRASGGGGLFFDRTLITKAIIDLAFYASDRLESECLGLDIVVDRRTGEPVVLEISYGFSHTAIMEAGGYFDRDGIWHNEPLNAPRAVLARMLGQAGKVGASGLSVMSP